MSRHPPQSAQHAIARAHILPNISCAIRGAGERLAFPGRGYLPRALWLGWVLGAILTACALPPASTATPEAQADWITHRLEGLTLALPRTWEVLSLDTAAIEDFAATIMAEHAASSTPGGDEAGPRAAADIAFLAYDPASGSDTHAFPASLNIVRIPLPTEMPLALYTTINLAQLELLDGISKPIWHARVTTATGEAEEFRYALGRKSSTGEDVPISVTQFLAIHEGSAVVLTLMSEEGQANAYRSTFEQIGRSLSLTALTD